MTILPTNDMLFRKAFASPQHKGVTIGLVNDVLAVADDTDALRDSRL